MIRPANSAHIWATPDHLHLELPGIGKQTHQVAYPLSIEGLKACLACLQSRHDQSLIGERGDPTQHNVEQLIREYKRPIKRTKRRITSKEAESATEVLKRLGMIA